MVEVEGARVLVPSCSRKAEDGMVVRTDTERARHARRLVLEFLASSVDLSAAAPNVDEWMADYGAEPDRYGPEAATVAAQPAKVDNDLYVRDYARCILCYKCVDACGEQWQNTFAIAVAGRGFDVAHLHRVGRAPARLGLRLLRQLRGGVPHRRPVLRRRAPAAGGGEWDPERQTRTDTICPYCGVGCTLTLHVQDNEIVQGHLAPRPVRDPGQPVHQGPLRLPPRPEPGPEARGAGCPRCRRGAGCSRRRRLRLRRPVAANQMVRP